MPFVNYQHFAREWRCEWSTDADNESLMAIQAALNSLLEELSNVHGLESVQRIVSADGNFRVVTKLLEKDFKAWEEAEFAPEGTFLEALRAIPGVSNVQRQTYTLEDVKLSKRDRKRLQEYRAKEEVEKDPNVRKLKAVIQEGGKRGVEIEGAADFGGLRFFGGLLVFEPLGDLALLEESVKAMNARSDLQDLVRRGGSGHIGKMVFSPGAEQTAVLAYVPQQYENEISCEEWLEAALSKQTGGLLMEKKTEMGFCTGIIPVTDEFPIKVGQTFIEDANNFLRTKGLYYRDEEEPEAVYGDDDFPPVAPSGGA
eukprot:TRINITY_DN103640_c0_g1_i1.p1 TRINITY_DN103640_c0_g1~~TRINITY_DN103640_c0_g1_i1.p1  ORF type:complete len:313 (-),score=75.97 TRINITY_DN103640_c0_g1_i1:111-1049(-)